MFGWLRKRQEPNAHSAPRSADPVLKSGVDVMVTFLHANPTADDDEILQRLMAENLSQQQATRLVQFVPIAFTRFLFRFSGVQFAPNFVFLGPDRQLKAQLPVIDQPAYQEAWAHCEAAAASGSGDDYFVPIAARSGGYRSLQDLVQMGTKLSGILTGPPMMFE